MDWNDQLATSALWLLETYVICCALLIPVSAGLIRGTVWGRQFWQLTGPYFNPRQHGWRAPGAVALILFLTLCGVRLDVLFASWSNDSYTALQKLDAHAFWISMGIFSILAAVHVVRSLLNLFFSQRFTLHWRSWLNERLLNAWLADQAYYRSLHLAELADNPDQRIQQDITGFVDTSLDLVMKTISAIVSIFAFTIMLWGLSGPLELVGVEVPHALVFLVYAYILIATVFAVKIGRPLVVLNFLAEKYAADYRYALMRVREYAESIAFYAGEKVEVTILNTRFGALIGNAWKIVFRSMKFQGFNLGVSQVGAVFAFIIQAPRFFSRQITLGDMMQATSACGSVQDNLSFFRQAYDDFAGYRATLNRLFGFQTTIEAARALPRPPVTEQSESIGMRAMEVRTPHAEVLVRDLSFSLEAGEALLVQGTSGAGKTTLLRAFAGLWPYCTGEVMLPAQGVLFLSQRPYLPLGTLREALCYPSPVKEDGWVAQVLAEVQLAHLVPRLDETADWSRILSLGEQQRLAFGRVLWAKPAVVFLDEASSALDEGLEYAMYRLLRERLPACIVVSVGHRSSLLAHHTRRLEICGGGRWLLTPLAAQIGADQA